MSGTVRIAGRIAWIGKPTVDDRIVGSLTMSPLPLPVMGLVGGRDIATSTSSTVALVVGNRDIATSTSSTVALVHLGELTEISFWPDGEVRAEARVFADKLGDRRRFGCGIDMTPAYADLRNDGRIHGAIRGLTVYVLPAFDQPAWRDCYMEIVA